MGCTIIDEKHLIVDSEHLMLDPILQLQRYITHFSLIFNSIQLMMNNVSPLEAQAFNYLSFGLITFLNNFWTWLALTFWRNPSPNPELLLPPHDSVREGPDSGSVNATGPAPSPTVLGNGPNGAVDVDGVRKGKFTLYYKDDEIERECDSEDLTVTEEDAQRYGGIQEWWETWERLLRMKRGDNDKGWYTCQDLTTLNGTVVRLWDHVAFTTQSRNTYIIR